MSVIHGDCLEVMATLDAESIDAVVTDPPYDLLSTGARRGSRRVDSPDSPAGRRSGGFMGKAWDGTGIAFRPETWEAALRVAKPGAYLLAFGGTRTVHRMTCAIEDAGWIIRDMLVWIYASGFPKGRANLKPAWEPIVMARKPGPLRPLAIDACRIEAGADLAAHNPHTVRKTYAGPATINPGDNGQPYDTTKGRWPANVILTDPIFDGGWDGVVGGGETRSPNEERPLFRGATTGSGMGYGSTSRTDSVGSTYSDQGTYSRFFLVPKAARSDREPVLGEYAYRLHRERGDCDKLGAWDSADRSPSDRMASTSPARAISEDIRPETPIDSSSGTSSPGSLPTDPSPPDTRSTTRTATSRTTDSSTSSSSILSPTNDSTPGANSETASGGSPAGSAVSSGLWAPSTGISAPRAGRSTAGAEPATFGSWSSRSVCGRCGKPLPRVGSHPTVKPTELMRHLVRLVTPPGGIVLDPFLGSGTTALAAEQEGFAWIGIEKEAEYVAIAEARLNGTQKGMAL